MGRVVRDIAFMGAALAALCFGNIALAADIAVRTPAYKAPPPVSVYSWTGFYIGGNAGYGWSQSSTVTLSPDNGAGLELLGRLTPSTPSPFRSSGFVGGGQLGYNWQVNRSWLAGVEADFNYANVKGSSSLTSTFQLGIGGAHPAPIAVGRSLDWYGTLRARLGFLPTDHLLMFATGGLAFGKTTANASVTMTTGGLITVAPDGSTMSCVVGATCVAADKSRTAVGWTAGGGAEWALGNNVSLKAEYIYVALGNQTVHMTAVPPSSGTISVAARFDDANYHIVRGGINFKFGADPIVARY
jgi:outer membrane immunogenic protein